MVNLRICYLNPFNNLYAKRLMNIHWQLCIHAVGYDVVWKRNQRNCLYCNRWPSRKSRFDNGSRECKFCTYDISFSIHWNLVMHVTMLTSPCINFAACNKGDWNILLAGDLHTLKWLLRIVYAPIDQFAMSASSFGWCEPRPRCYPGLWVFHPSW